MEINRSRTPEPKQQVPTQPLVQEGISAPDQRVVPEDPGLTAMGLDLSELPEVEIELTESEIRSAQILADLKAVQAEHPERELEVVVHSSVGFVVNAAISPEDLLTMSPRDLERIVGGLTDENAGHHNLVEAVEVEGLVEVRDLNTGEILPVPRIRSVAPEETLDAFRIDLDALNAAVSPGPWAVTRDMGPETAIKDANGALIAIFEPKKGAAEQTPFEKGIPHLMAEGPELLAVLKEVLATPVAPRPGGGYAVLLSDECYLRANQIMDRVESYCGLSSKFCSTKNWEAPVWTATPIDGVPGPLQINDYDGGLASIPGVEGQGEWRNAQIMAVTPQMVEALRWVMKAPATKGPDGVLGSVVPEKRLRQVIEAVTKAETPLPPRLDLPGDRLAEAAPRMLKALKDTLRDLENWDGTARDLGYAKQNLSDFIEGLTEKLLAAPAPGDPRGPR